MFHDTKMQRDVRFVLKFEEAVCVSPATVSFTEHLKLRISEVLITAELELKIQRNAKSFHEK